MIIKQHVEIEHKFYKAQESMKFLHGDNYDSKVAETRKVIERIMNAHKCDELTAT